MQQIDRARTGASTKSVVEGVYTVPGDGGIDFVAVLKELPGYSGWLVVEAEQDPKKAHPLTYARWATPISAVSPSRPASCKAS